MAKCKRCEHDVIVGKHDNVTVLLDPFCKTYAAAAFDRSFPEQDGDPVFLSFALVEHAAVCTGARRDIIEQRRQGKVLYDRQKGR